MSTYECLACGYNYEEETEGTAWDKLPEDWSCPVCGAQKSFFDNTNSTSEPPKQQEEKNKEDITAYLGEWRKSKDTSEPLLENIQNMAITGNSVTEPMRTQKPVIAWDDILIKGAQLSKFPLTKETNIDLSTIIGSNAKHPLKIDLPIYISHMSFGALSKEIKTALAKGSAAVKTAICSGEGGILPDEIDSAYRYIFEYVPNQYSVNESNLKRADAIEIKIGQSAKPGMGGHLPAEKVTDEIATVRNKTPNQDIHSPAVFSDIKSANDLKRKVDWLREKSDGKPIGVKIAAGHIEEDIDIIIQAGADFITIDGRGGATGSAPKFLKDSTSVPTLFAIYRARKHLDKRGAKQVSLVITGGLRVSSDFAKALALGADAVAIATSAMIAGGCQQYRQCHTGKCPVGIATQDEELRKRLNVELSARRVENFFKATAEELRDLARITGLDNIHLLSQYDLCTTNSEISDHTEIEHV